MQLLINFNEIQGPDYAVFISDSVANYFNLTMQDLFKRFGHDGLYLKTAQYAVQEGKLFFAPCPDGDFFKSAMDNKNMFRVKFKENETLLATAVLFNGKPTVFFVMWEELNNYAHDGQNVKK